MSGLGAEAQREALELLRALIRIDTTNPPGQERQAAVLLADWLTSPRLDPKLLTAEGDRVSLVVRLKGRGELPPLLLTAHLDVVAADPSRWRHPPFGAVIDDGWLYGRGAVDMKNMAAMSAAVLRALAEGPQLARDVIFAAVADEEAGCTLGSRFLSDHHPELIRAEFALGEIGGFTQEINGRRLYPIQVAQKGMVWMTARVEGTPGHGSMPRTDNPVVELGRLLSKLTPDALPIQPTAAARRFIEAIARSQPALARVLLPLLLQPRLGDRLLRLLPDKGVARAMNAILRNTVTPTVLRAGTKTNVIPGHAEAELDGRTLPGQRADDLLDALRGLLGDRVRLEVTRTLDPVEASADTPLFAQLCDAVRAMDPDGLPVPYIIPGFTDAAPLSKLGITYYGFSPLWLPPTPKVAFSELYHGDDERIPVEGFRRGLDCLHAAVRRWCEGPAQPSAAR